MGNLSGGALDAFDVIGAGVIATELAPGLERAFGSAFDADRWPSMRPRPAAAFARTRLFEWATFRWRARRVRGDRRRGDRDGAGARAQAGVRVGVGGGPLATTDAAATCPSVRASAAFDWAPFRWRARGP